MNTKLGIPNIYDWKVRFNGRGSTNFYRKHNIYDWKARFNGRGSTNF